MPIKAIKDRELYQKNAQSGYMSIYMRIIQVPSVHANGSK